MITAVALALICVDHYSKHGSLPILLPLLLAVVAVSMAVWFERVATKTGLEECEDGFIDRANFRSQLLRLDEIDHFDHRRELTLDRVYAVLRDGRGHPIVGLQQGQRVVWDDGETRDIVGVLNERLQCRRQGAARQRP